MLKEQKVTGGHRTSQNITLTSRTASQGNNRLSNAGKT